MCLLFTTEGGHLTGQGQAQGLRRSPGEVWEACSRDNSRLGTETPRTQVRSGQAPSSRPFKNQLPSCPWPWHSALATPAPHPHSAVSTVRVFTGVYSDTQAPSSAAHTPELRIRGTQAGCYVTESSPASQAMVSKQKYHPPSPGKTVCVEEAQQGRGSLGFSEHSFRLTSVAKTYW